MLPPPGMWQTVVQFEPKLVLLRRFNCHSRKSVIATGSTLRFGTTFLMGQLCSSLVPPEMRQIRHMPDGPLTLSSTAGSWDQRDGKEGSTRPWHFWQKDREGYPVCVLISYQGGDIAAVAPPDARLIPRHGIYRAYYTITAIFHLPNGLRVSCHNLLVQTTFYFVHRPPASGNSATKVHR